MAAARIAEERDPGVRATDGERAPARPAVGPASSVLALQRSAGNRAVGMLLRQPTVAPPGPVRKGPIVRRIDKDKVHVTMEDGRRYYVTRVRRPVVKTKRSPVPPGVGFGRDDDRIYLKIDWCRDTKGEIQIGANVPEVVKDAVKEISKGIQSGDPADAIKKAVDKAEIKPSVKFEIARSGEWNVEGEVDMSIEGSGVTGGGGEFKVQRGEWDLGLEVRNKDGSTTLGFKVTWTPGRSNRRFKCPDRQHIYLGQETSFIAEEQVYVPGHTEQRTRQVEKHHEATRFIYFHYAKDKVDEKRSAGEIGELQQNFADGFKVSLVEGLTSPEGSHAPGAGGRWQGNTRLAQQRATAALKRAKKACSSPEGCLAGGEDQDPAREREEPELYTVVRDGVDVEGRELQEAAVQGFLSSPEEERHRTPELLKALERARTPAEKAKLIYPFLRRAVVHLTKTTMETETYDFFIKGHDETRPGVEAPPDVEKAVIPHFQAQDIFK